MSEIDPIGARLEQLHDQWVMFANCPKARLLVWEVDDDERAMVDAFLSQECEPASAATPDSFMRLVTPFVAQGQYAQALVRELVAQVEPSNGSERTQSSAVWRIEPRAKESDLDVLVRVLGEMHARYFDQDAIAKLVVQLEPEVVHSSSAYQHWLCELVRVVPEGVRFFVLARPNTLLCDALVRADPVRVRREVCGLDMMDALRELAQRAAGGTPGGRLRVLQVELAAAIRRGDLVAAERRASEASELAHAHGWPHFAAITGLTLAAGYNAHQRPLEALRTYGATARECAQDADFGEQGADAQAACLLSRVQLHAQLGMAATLLQLGSWRRAVEAYEEAARRALALQDGRLELDCWRLAAFGQSATGDAQAAWQLGMRGLRVGESLDADVRTTSTLPFLANQLLRLTDAYDALSVYREPLERRIIKLLGSEWRNAFEGRS